METTPTIPPLPPPVGQRDVGQERAARLSGVDGLRGLAALVVLVFHTYGAADAPQWRPVRGANVLRPLSDGWAAVNLFLVLSGFCLYWPFAVRPGRPPRQLRLGDYAARRALRILPTYYASLAFVTAVGLLTPMRHTEPRCLPLAWWDVVDHVLLVNAWVPASMNSWNSVTWSLSVEWTWYFGFPLAMVLFRRVGAANGLAAMAGVTIAYRVGLHAALGPAAGHAVQVGYALRTFLPGRLFEFGAGMAVAAVAAARVPAPRWAHVVGPAVIVVALVAARASEPVDTFLPVRDMLYGTASAALIYMVVVPDRGVLRWAAEHVVLVWLGEFSYTLYLFHLAFVTAVALYLKSRGVTGLRLFVESLLLLPVTLAACWGLYFVVERPFLVRRPRPTVAPAVPSV